MAPGLGAVAEFTFWQEFATRFNFIAVDYLVYTREVVGNIRHLATVGGILFANALREFDQASARGKPSFAHVVTTSNHRPFTYPAGRIDIPSPGGREGGVKYTDFAIGERRLAARQPESDDAPHATSCRIR